MKEPSAEHGDTDGEGDFCDARRDGRADAAGTEEGAPQQDAYTILRGDAFSILRTLPAASCDAVATDPPYSSGALHASGRRADPAAKYQTSGTGKQYPPLLGDGKDQRSFTAWATLWLTECLRVARDGAPLMLFTDWRQLPAMSDALQGAGWLWLGVVVWNKRSARPQLGKFRQQCEYILFGSKGRFAPAHTRCLPGVFDVPIIPQAKRHLTEKPAALMRELLEVAKPDALVLDPFLGGGSTAVAALETGRRCIGIELSEEYAAIAKERCIDALSRRRGEK